MRHRQRLGERPLREAYILRQQVQEARTVRQVFAKHAWVRRGAGELHGLAQVVAALAAQRAGHARNAGLDGHAIANAQKRGGIAVLIDAEYAFDANYAKNLGVDIDNLLVSQPDTGEQALEIADTLVRSGAIDIIVIDSVAALVPAAEVGTRTTLSIWFYKTSRDAKTAWRRFALFAPSTRVVKQPKWAAR